MQNFKGRFITSTVDCNTGETIYHEQFEDVREFFKICKAANSLPLIARISYINETPMLDGGVSDAIPIEKAIREGWEKIIVVLTREESYRKVEGMDWQQFLFRLIYRKYPNLLAVGKRRGKRYNDSVEKVLELEKQGKAFVLRPTTLKLSNNESRVDKLVEAYQHGYETIAARYQELLDFLNK